MDTSMLPGRSPGPQQGRGKHWIGWIWDGVDTWLTWPCETQSDRMYGVVARWCRKWGCSGVWVKTATGGGWSQFTLLSAMVSSSVSPRNVIWWNPDSHGYGIQRWHLCEVMELWGWSLLNEMNAFMYKRHTELPSPSPVWGYNKKCVTRKDPPWSRCGLPFPLFISPRYFVMANPEDLRQHPNNLQKVQ